MSKFTEGQKVITTSVLPSDVSQGVRVGDCAEVVFAADSGAVVHYIEGKAKGKHISMADTQLEAFLYPKYKVGHKFDISTIDGKSHVEVVAVKFNKKLKTYAYMVYRVSDGHVGCLLEKEIPANPEKMTLKQIEKELGKKVVVINNHGKVIAQ